MAAFNCYYILIPSSYLLSNDGDLKLRMIHYPSMYWKCVLCNLVHKCMRCSTAELLNNADKHLINMALSNLKLLVIGAEGFDRLRLYMGIENKATQ